MNNVEPEECYRIRHIPRTDQKDRRRIGKSVILKHDGDRGIPDNNRGNIIGDREMRKIWIGIIAITISVAILGCINDGENGKENQTNTTNGNGNGEENQTEPVNQTLVEIDYIHNATVLIVELGAAYKKATIAMKNLNEGVTSWEELNVSMAKYNQTITDLLTTLKSWDTPEKFSEFEEYMENTLIYSKTFAKDYFGEGFIHLIDPDDYDKAQMNYELAQTEQERLQTLYGLEE